MTLQSTESLASADNRWIHIIDHVSAHTENLADEFVRLFSESSHYLRTVSGLDLWHTAHDTMELLLLQLVDRPVPGYLQGLAANLGARRARQGVSCEELLAMIRLDFQVLWDGMRRVADDEGLQVLVGHANQLHSTVETHVDAVRSAYVLEEARLQRDSKIVATRALSRLLEAGEEVESVAPMLADQMGVNQSSRFEVAFVHGEAAVSVQKNLAAAEGAGRLLSWECTTGMVLLREQYGGKDWRKDLPGVPGAYIGGVIGLAAVPAAMEQVQFIASQAPPDPGGEGTLVTEDDVWLGVVSGHLHRVLPGVCEQVDRLAVLPEDERARVLEAFFTYTATGSVKTTAENLYCHRNTVVNKLRTFRESTGLDPATPIDAAKALVALGRQNDHRAAE